jgi:multiple sugar transport system substrate-binding protein
MKPPRSHHRFGWWVSMALAVILLGCGREPVESDARVRLVLAVSVNARDRPSYQAAVAAFRAAHPNIEVQIMEIPGNFYQKMLVMMAARNAPDLMWMGQGFQALAARGVFLDVTDRVAADIKADEFAPEALEWYRYNDRQYGVAFGLDLRLICYNKALFDEAGLPYPTDGWTLDDFIRTARALTLDRDSDGRIDQYGFEGDLDISLFNAKVISEQGKGALCNSPEMMDFLQTNVDLAEKYRVSPHGRQMVNEALRDPVTVFRQGHTAMMTMATWNMPELQDRCANMRWDVVSNPIVRRHGHWGSCQAIVISKDTNHPDEAWLLAKQFLAKDFQIGKFPVILPSSLAAQRELAASTHGKPPSVASMIVASHALQRMPRVANMHELMQFWLDATDSVWTLRATPAGAMRRAEAEINRAIAMQQREEGP